ncbi:MAG: G8 domain-containing protein [Pseudomonadota bacterium]
MDHMMMGPAVLWSDVKTSLTDADGNVVIPHDMVVVLDESTPPLGTLAIHGTLRASDAADVTLTADNVVVFGALEVGTEDAPHTRDFDIVLTGEAGDPDIVLADWAGDHGGMHGGLGHMDHMGHMTDPIDNKALIVAPGGKIDLHGAEKASWTLLETNAEAGSTVIEVRDASGWQVGDLLAIAPTDVDAFEVEERTIVSIDDGTVTLDRPLDHLHTGYDMALDNGRVLELRAEVSNLSRNITIEGANEGQTRILDTNANDPDHVATVGYGGHTIFMADTQVKISGVEFTELGISGELGRYPVHFHHSGDMEGSYVKDSAIHHVFQRGLVVHQADNALIEGNTVYDTVGHAVYIEDGVETGNRFADNLVMMPRSNPDEVELGDINNTNHRASGFWITNPSNEFEGNHVAAVPAGMGFWFQPPDHSPESAGLTRNDPRREEPLLQFEGNVAHSIDFDRGIGKNLAYANGWTGVALDLGTSKRVLKNGDSGDAPIQDFTAWKIGNIAIAMDGAPNPATIKDALLAEARVMFESDGFGGHVAIQDATIVAEIPDGAARPDWPSQHPGPLLIHAQKDIEFVGLELYGGDGLLSPNKSSHTTDQVILSENADGEGIVDLYALNQWLEPPEGSTNATVDGKGGNDRIGGDNTDNTLIGGAGDDFIGGHGGDDIMIGGVGDDELSSSSWRKRATGSNDDVFLGGLGNDTIDVVNVDGNHRNTVIYRQGDGNDTIMNFKGGADKVVLVGLSEADLDQDGDGDFDDLDLAALSSDGRDGRFTIREVQLPDAATLTFTGPVNKFALSASDFAFIDTAAAATGVVATALELDALFGGATPPPADAGPTDPDPVDPDPIDPDPADPDPVDPYPTDPDPADPYPADPDPVAPTPGAGVPLIDAPTMFSGDDALVIEHIDAFATETGTASLSFRPDGLDGVQTLLSKDSKGFDQGGHLSVSIRDGALEVRAQTDTASLTLTGGAVSVQAVNDLTLSWADDMLTVTLNGAEIGVIEGWTGGLSSNLEPIVLGASQASSGDGVANRLNAFFEGEISAARFDTAVEVATDPLPAAPDPGAAASQDLDALVAELLAGFAGAEVSVTGDTRVRGGSDDDLMTGDSGGNKMSGRDGNDLLVGGDGFDRLAGGDGDDTLVGGADKDWLVGRDGADRFVWGFGADRDTIGDFDAGEGDVIDVTTAGFESFADILDNAVQRKNGALITAEDGATLMIRSAALDDLKAEWFDVA